ncbi:transporter substrate-binding domain-containing protein [Mycoplasma sp. P36-A1]|uniref:transporter substrate-binding domain-containing protein n=1 Tax=Mycoplasma sp. P36-A1 TaxID=3252900 RepID=UPI003C2CB6C0
MKKNISIIMTLVICFILAGCSNNHRTTESDKNHLDKKTLTIGLECDFTPYNWTTTSAKKGEYSLPIDGSKGYCEGYDIYIAQQISKQLNLDIVVKKMSWDGVIPALKSGQIDAIIGGMAPTTERQKEIAFSKPYFTDKAAMAIIIPKDSSLAKAKTLADFAGKNITAQQGTTQANHISDIKDNKSTALLPDVSSLVEAVKAKTVDGYLADSKVAQEQVAANPQLMAIDVSKEINLDPSESTVAIGISKDNTDLKNKINGVLDSISEKTRISVMEQLQQEIGE